MKGYGLMSSFQCPYCSNIMALSDDTLQNRFPGFRNHHDRDIYGYGESCIQIAFHMCPNCKEYTIFALGKGTKVSDINTVIRPKSLAKQFPDYIPKAIRQDYEESCAIINLSPKASATLSRRCLQGMIRDFWNVRESNLSKAIEQLEGKIPATQWKVINGVRRIGNIGAHMEKDINLIVDIEPGEAEKLIKLIELLMEQWYINRHQQDSLYTDIIGIDEAKQSERKRTE